MFTVEIHHHDKDWVRGDLEDKYELLECKNFKTRKAAKDYIESKLKGKNPKDVKRNYHKGDATSRCYWFTGVTWVHVNTGEDMEEYYIYLLKKTKVY